MIYFNFIIDFAITQISPLKSYLIIYNIDKAKLIDILLVGLLCDFMYHKLPYNTLVLLILHFIFRHFKIKNNTLKNNLIYLLYFNITFFTFNNYILNYFIYLLEGLIILNFYIFIKKLSFNEK